MNDLDKENEECILKEFDSISCKCDWNNKRPSCFDMYIYALTLIRDKYESDFFSKYNPKQNSYLAVVRYYVLNKDNKRFHFKDGNLDISTMAHIFFIDNIPPNHTTKKIISDTGIEYLDGTPMQYIPKYLIKHIFTKLHNWDKNDKLK